MNRVSELFRILNSNKDNFTDTDYYNDLGNVAFSGFSF